ncbi:MAG TPA: hypothetical protein PLZ57_11745 [Pseudobdellovibrionaceae bacterium]|nr:hypothetical protein [Pseudobdellovibrionaceae bacterium]
MARPLGTRLYAVPLLQVVLNCAAFNATLRAFRDFLNHIEVIGDASLDLMSHFQL